jgi:hypothetical protein
MSSSLYIPTDDHFVNVDSLRNSSVILKAFLLLDQVDQFFYG